jgi:hypothetical protein
MTEAKQEKKRAMEVDDSEGDLDYGPCFNDVLNILDRYNQSVQRLVSTSASDDIRFTEQANKWPEIARDISQAVDKYRKQLEQEHSRWLKAQSTVTEAQVAQQNEIYEAVNKSWTSCDVLKKLRDRHEQHLSVLHHQERNLDFDQGYLPQDEAEHQLSICKTVASDLRQQWRAGQRKRLQVVAERMRGSRKEIQESLQKYIKQCSDARANLQKLWDAEVVQVQSALDRMASVYAQFIKSCLEAKLKDVQRHSKEQTDFFAHEIQEAIAREQAEQQLHTAQLRRMRIAIMKWRTDYVKEAQDQAVQATAIRLEAERIKATAAADQKIQEDLKRLRKCQMVLSKVWERLPGEEKPARAFLQKVQSAMPADPCVLCVYMDYLEEHGLLAALQSPKDGDEDDVRLSSPPSIRTPRTTTENEAPGQRQKSNPKTRSAGAPRKNV